MLPAESTVDGRLGAAHHAGHDTSALVPDDTLNRRRLLERQLCRHLFRSFGGLSLWRKIVRLYHVIIGGQRLVRARDAFPPRNHLGTQLFYELFACSIPESHLFPFQGKLGARVTEGDFRDFRPRGLCRQARASRGDPLERLCMLAVILGR